MQDGIYFVANATEGAYWQAKWRDSDGGLRTVRIRGWLDDPLADASLVQSAARGEGAPANLSVYCPVNPDSEVALCSFCEYLAREAKIAAKASYERGDAPGQESPEYWHLLYARLSVERHLERAKD